MSTQPDILDEETREALVAYARRLADLDGLVKSLQEDRKDLLKEIASKGYDKGLFQAAVKLAVAEEVDLHRNRVAVTDLYLDALSGFDLTPLGRAAARVRDVTDEITVNGETIYRRPKKRDGASVSVHV